MERLQNSAIMAARLHGRTTNHSVDEGVVLSIQVFDDLFTYWNFTLLLHGTVNKVQRNHPKKIAINSAALRWFVLLLQSIPFPNLFSVTYYIAITGVSRPGAKLLFPAPILQLRGLFRSAQSGPAAPSHATQNQSNHLTSVNTHLIWASSRFIFRLMVL